MRRALARLPLLAFVLACTDAVDPGPGVGQACAEDQSCADGLTCLQLVCRDDRGPRVTVIQPEALTPFASDTLELGFSAALTDLAPDDRVQLSLTPSIDEFLGQDAIIDGNQAVSQILFTDYVPSRPYHLRAQITDAGGQPYANPSAQSEKVVFIRDAAIPDTPQVAIVWPPAGYQHPVGVDLEIEVAVLPGSFELVGTSDLVCAPLPDCTPAFAPECEDDCGPVSRRGHVKIFTIPDYPACLFDEPIGCNGNYIAALRPNTDTAGSSYRSSIPAQFFATPGPLTLHATLSYDDHNPYPTAESVIYESIQIELVD